MSSETPIKPVMPMNDPTLFDLGKREPNPCVAKYGHGPADKRCKDCARLIVRSFAKNYYKCELRGTTGNDATDHRVRWRACAQFVPNGGAA